MVAELSITLKAPPKVEGEFEDGELVDVVQLGSEVVEGACWARMSMACKMESINWLGTLLFQL